MVTGVDASNFPGKVDKISALVDPDTRAVAVRVVVDNPQHALRKQMYVRVLIHSRNESTGLLIPISAVLRDDENLPFVYVAQADGSFARRHDHSRLSSGDQYEIPTGLRAGDQIVVVRRALRAVHAKPMSATPAARGTGAAQRLRSSTASSPPRCGSAFWSC